jgi:hypothetical protein
MPFLPIILALLLAFAVVTALPMWPFSKKWGYYPSGGLFMLLLVVLLLVWTGRF